MYIDSDIPNKVHQELHGKSYDKVIVDRLPGELLEPFVRLDTNNRKLLITYRGSVNWRNDTNIEVSNLIEFTPGPVFDEPKFLLDQAQYIFTESALPDYLRHKLKRKAYDGAGIMQS